MMEERKKMPETIQTVNDKIRILKQAKEILHEEYQKTDFHKKREANPDSTVPSSPDDEEAINLLTAISKIEEYIKKFKDDQFILLKQQENQ